MRELPPTRPLRRSRHSRSLHLALLTFVPPLGFLLVPEIHRLRAQEKADAAVPRYDANATPGPGELREFVRNGNVDRVRSLLEAGADANQEYENGFTPIYFAKDPRIVDLLIAHGARLNIRDRASLQSPIENAAENYDRDPEHGNAWKTIIAKLRDAGAQYTIDAAIYLNDVQFVEKKLAADDSWVNNSEGAQSVPLRLAARKGRVEICKLLLEHKADPNAFEEGCGFPIMVDAVNHPAVVKLLIDHGADLRRRITWQCGRSGSWIIGDDATSLHHAAGNGHPETIHLLIENGVDIFATAHGLFERDLQQTALEVAAFFGKADNVNAIVSHPMFEKAALNCGRLCWTGVFKSGHLPARWLGTRSDSILSRSYLTRVPIQMSRKMGSRQRKSPRDKSTQIAIREIQRPKG